MTDNDYRETVVDRLNWICVWTFLAMIGSCSANAQVTLPISSRVISYTDTLESCQLAVYTEYETCGKLGCRYAEEVCERVLANISPSGDDGIERSVDALPNTMIIYETEVYE